MRSRLPHLLRLPAVVLGEIAALVVACALGAAWQKLHVFQSPWFAALAILAAVSLAIVIRDQIYALFRVGATTRRIGSTLLHVGLLLVILAGAVHALFATEAVVDLVEGETLPPTAVAWSGQFPGLFARPFQLEQPVTLKAVHGRRYPDGSMRDLTARLSVGELAVNSDLSLPGGRLFLTSDFSTAALVEWVPVKREAALLDGLTREGTSAGPNGLRAHVRAFSERPESVDVRVMRGNGLLYAGDLKVGQTITLAGGETLALRGLPPWVRLRGSRDYSPGFVYLGFALILAGSVLLFVGVVPGGPRAVAAATWLERTRPGPLLHPVLIALALCSCRPSHEQARQLVERYNQVVSEAYRRDDVRLIDPVVGPNEGRKLTGLIGVRHDFGLTLDSEMLALDVTGVERTKNEMKVRTRERWRYRDRKIGTGEQVGEESVDSYEMLYVFRATNRAWVVDGITFASPPQVGRKQTPWQESRETVKP